MAEKFKTIRFHYGVKRVGGGPSSNLQEMANSKFLGWKSHRIFKTFS